MTKNAIININPLGFPWETADPFLFCVHHEDYYPKGNNELGPQASLEGRQIGQDFVIKDGWRMYHGDKVPGFPMHPHRGFETVTVVQTGLIDHADSLGAAGRYGGGDVQWMTAGKGIQHSEMFPLLRKENDNPLELFQIWLNLPADNKMVEPFFSMQWRESIPKVIVTNDNGLIVEIDVIAGNIKDTSALPPPPDSWAANPVNEVAILTIKMQAGSRWSLPQSAADINRTLYFYKGSSLTIDNETIQKDHSVILDAALPVTIINGETEGYLLLLQGRPINEPVVQYGPFVMNTNAEIQQAFMDYRKTQFGGWPWAGSDPVHGDRGRFARYIDGSEDEPGAS